MVDHGGPRVYGGPMGDAQITGLFKRRLLQQSGDLRQVWARPEPHSSSTFFNALRRAACTPCHPPEVLLVNGIEWNITPLKPSGSVLVVEESLAMLICQCVLATPIQRFASLFMALQEFSPPCGKLSCLSLALQ